MSRIGKKPVPFKAPVKVTVNGRRVNVEGPLGKLERELPASVTAAVADGNVTVTRVGDDNKSKAMHGLFRALINNMVLGVEKGFSKKLEIHGVGYGAKLIGKDKIELAVGYANKITLPIPPTVKVELKVNAQDKNVTDVHISGADKQAVGELAAVIRKQRPPEPYKQKGIRYHDEVVMKKQGKAMSS